MSRSRLAANDAGGRGDVGLGFERRAEGCVAEYAATFERRVDGVRRDPNGVVTRKTLGDGCTLPRIGRDLEDVVAGGRLGFDTDRGIGAIVRRGDAEVGVDVVEDNVAVGRSGVELQKCLQRPVPGESVPPDCNCARRCSTR